MLQEYAGEFSCEESLGHPVDDPLDVLDKRRYYAQKFRTQDPSNIPPQRLTKLIELAYSTSINGSPTW